MIFEPILTKKETVVCSTCFEMLVNHANAVVSFENAMKSLRKK